MPRILSCLIHGFRWVSAVKVASRTPFLPDLRLELVALLFSKLISLNVEAAPKNDPTATRKLAMTKSATVERVSSVGVRQSQDFVHPLEGPGGAEQPRGDQWHGVGRGLRAL